MDRLLDHREAMILSAVLSAALTKTLNPPMFLSARADNTLTQRLTCSSSPTRRERERDERELITSAVSASTKSLDRTEAYLGVVQKCADTLTKTFPGCGRYP